MATIRDAMQLQKLRPYQLINVTEVARLIGVSERTVYRYVESGSLPRPVVRRHMNSNINEWKIGDIRTFIKGRIREDDRIGRGKRHGGRGINNT